MTTCWRSGPNFLEGFDEQAVAGIFDHIFARGRVRLGPVVGLRGERLAEVGAHGPRPVPRAAAAGSEAGSGCRSEDRAGRFHGRVPRHLVACGRSCRAVRCPWVTRCGRRIRRVESRWRRSACPASCQRKRPSGEGGCGGESRSERRRWTQGCRLGVGQFDQPTASTIGALITAAASPGLSQNSFETGATKR